MQAIVVIAAGLATGVSASNASSHVRQPDSAQDSITWAYPALSATEPDAIFSFVNDERHLCVQGPHRHMTFMLALLKSSVLGGFHVHNALESSTCEERGFNIIYVDDEGQAEDHCFPPAQLFYEEVWVDDPMYGWIPGGNLVEAMVRERDIIDDLNERATQWEEDSWFQLSCNCLEGSTLSHENPQHSEESCEEISEDFPASFVSAGGNACIEAPLRYATRALATQRSSFAAEVFGASSIAGTSCADRGFDGDDGISEQSPCYPRATMYFHSQEGRNAAFGELSDAADSYSQQFSDLLGDIPMSALLGCNCMPGSSMYDELSEEDEAHCGHLAVVSPVVAYWPEESRL